MVYSMDTLIVFAELTIAFVAFSVIVASLRVTSGEPLSPFQILLITFFTECGLLVFTVSLSPLVLFQYWPDELLVAKMATWIAFISVALYLPFYLWRRSRINAPLSVSMVVNALGWFICGIILGQSLLGIFWDPSMAQVVTFIFWGLCSLSLAFVTFLSSFVSKERHA